MNVIDTDEKRALENQKSELVKYRQNLLALWSKAKELHFTSDLEWLTSRITALDDMIEDLAIKIESYA